jgi:hypothetical protein
MVAAVVCFLQSRRTTRMTSPRMTVGVASNERRMFEITIPNIGKIVCETSTRLDGPTSGREDERKALAKLHGQQLSEALTKAIESY